MGRRRSRWAASALAVGLHAAYGLRGESEAVAPEHYIGDHEVIWSWGSSVGERGTAQPDNWMSVTHDQLLYTNPNITKLTIANVELSVLPRYSLPPQLTDVMIANCDLTTLPHDIGAMTALRQLDISNNQIVSIAKKPSTITYTNLVAVNAKNNNLTTFNLSAPNLSRLDLTGNALSAIPNCIYGMLDLAELYLASNSIPVPVRITYNEFEFLSALDYFDVDAPPGGAADCGDDQAHSLKGNIVCVTSTVGPPLPTSAPTASGFWSYSTLSWFLLVSGIIEAIVGVFVCFVYKRRRTYSRGVQYTSSHSSGERERLLSVEQVIYASMESLAMSPLTTRFEHNVPRLECDAISMEKRLAQGGYGEVWLGHYHASVVAIKILLPEKRSQSDIAAFLREITLLASLDHPRIVRCIGAAWPKSKRDMMLLTEYVAGGDLRALLDLDPNMKWPSTKVRYALHIAEALEYLHSLDMVHRDIKAKNVLVDPSENGAKVCDFGVALQLHPTVEDTVDVTSHGFGTSRWMAPEVLTGDAYTKAADIYAFGIVLSELDSHQIPFANERTASGNDLTNLAILQRVVNGQLKPKFGASCPPGLVALADLCLHPNPKARPAAHAVVATLTALLCSV
ncbi:TKL protein kinase [Saprolegnia diclina VS20]|uniref:TKL protein kinase n=1 Tax=Saprolegnia diclina (strain VS20) TaxID=1156394 RepID=T0S397_SAPDV|nr:TKL protein kinase [Saprolegnia diclina VS20]EQC39478.1 TKL protein kinase [Saprolegnia diclina VS20]|eukprot:XP_008606750.1 TKL protein kinase [Saprolegnia diclina VS20]